MANSNTASQSPGGALDVAPLETANGAEAKLSVLDDLVDVNVFTPASFFFSQDVSSLHRFRIILNNYELLPPTFLRMSAIASSIAEKKFSYTSYCFTNSGLSHCYIVQSFLL